MSLLTIQKQALVVSQQEQSDIKGGTNTTSDSSSIIVTDINEL